MLTLPQQDRIFKTEEVICPGKKRIRSSMSLLCFVVLIKMFDCVL